MRTHLGVEASPELRCANGDAPLCSSARSSDGHRLVDILVSNGAPTGHDGTIVYNCHLNCVTAGSGGMAVQIAGSHGRVEALERLVHNRANLNVECEGSTALIEAARDSNIYTMEKLVECGAHCDFSTKSMLLTLITSKSMRI